MPNISTAKTAELYSRNGWNVFPLHTPQGSGCSCGNDCGKPGKHPRISKWQEVSCDPGQVAAWWLEYPDANIGLRLDGLAVVDVDPRHGGNDSLAALESEIPEVDRLTLYALSRQKTGGNGTHYLFRAQEGVETVRGFRPGLDYLTGHAFYICVDPSRHARGGIYEWEGQNHPLDSTFDAIGLDAPPLWVLNAVSGSPAGTAKAKKAEPRKKKTNPLPDVFPEGGRDVGLASAAGKMRRSGFSKDEITAALCKMNQERCKPPLPDSDIVRIAGSIAKKDPSPIDEDEGIVKGLADAIQSDAHFAQDTGKCVYHFEHGVYKPTGEAFIDRRVKELCKVWSKSKSWSPELATKVMEWIRVDAPVLWEQPLMDTLNCANGLVDIATGTLREHSHEYLSPVQIAASFDPDAACPHIEKFIKDVFPDDARHLAYEIAAWLMLANTNLQKSVLLLGEGSNGKSGFLTLIRNLLGRDNVSALTLHKLEDDKFAMARLVGKLANICADLPTKALAGTSMFKALTGNDLMNAERKFEGSFEFRPFARLVFSANTAPRSDDSTHGFFRRWLVIPFTRSFDESDPNTLPPEVLNARLAEPGELSGLLNKALAALTAVRRGRFTESASTRAAMDDFRRTTDPLAVWLDQNTVERGDGVIAKEELRRAYGQACQDAGRPVLGDVQFTATLKRLRSKVQPGQRRINGRVTQVYTGIGMLALDSEEGMF